MNCSDMVKSLRSLGLKNGDNVLLHSSLSCLGHLPGGAETVIEAFLQVIGSDGTLLVPAFGALGVIPDCLKKRPDAVISDSPVGTVAAIGPEAEAFCRGHYLADTAHGKGTPYTRLAERNGYICLLGVDQDRNTSLHSVEALLELPYLGQATRTFVTPEGREMTKSWNFYPGPHRDFIGLDRALREAGAMTQTRIGNGQVRLIRAAAMFEILLAMGAKDPAFALCDNPACMDCVRQRAAIFAAGLAKESFRLTVSARLAGRYVPEIIESLEMSGIPWVELDYLQGRSCAFLAAGELRRAVEDFSQKGIQISALRVPVFPDDGGGKLVELAKECGISRLILPLSHRLNELEAFQNAGIRLSFANTCQSAVSARKQLEGAKFMTFQAANFVAACEKPFLQSYRIGRFGSLIDQLDLSDCSWDGTPARLGRGNGEIKELVSILRCHSFAGFLSLSGGQIYPGDFSTALKDFRELLHTI